MQYVPLSFNGAYGLQSIQQTDLHFCLSFVCSGVSTGLFDAAWWNANRFIFLMLNALILMKVKVSVATSELIRNEL